MKTGFLFLYTCYNWVFFIFIVHPPFSLLQVPTLKFIDTRGWSLKGPVSAPFQRNTYKEGFGQCLALQKL